MAEVFPSIGIYLQEMNQHQFTDSEIEGVYRAIYERRDIRNFTPAALAPDQIRRFFLASHH